MTYSSIQWSNKQIGGFIMKCVACEKELTKKDLLYTEDKQAYCVNPFTCSENHPNSVKNILARGAAVKLYNEVELEENTFDKLEVSDEMKDRITKAVTKPQSIRLSKVPIAHYLLAKQEEEGLGSISEAVRYCIEIAMKVEPLTGNVPTREEKREAVLSKAQELESQSIVDQTKGLSGALTGIVVPDVPKTLNVDWDEIKRQREAAANEPVSVPDDEVDEF
jgi:hypothetical protein